ncbi:MAG: hypothetical protein A2V67_05290 [Deltaproteobacteria bacterium RBG_13_61_14]|nr:MAG: hypothetical protein A2V67_05290 [Deltaproteobacteria bacterium RBG_13_61_14]
MESMAIQFSWEILANKGMKYVKQINNRFLWHSRSGSELYFRHKRQWTVSNALREKSRPAIKVFCPLPQAFFPLFSLPTTCDLQFPDRGNSGYLTPDTLPKFVSLAVSGRACYA